MSTDKLAYSIPEAAEMASTSISNLRRHIALNNLTVRYPSRVPVILADELKAWLNALATEAPRK